MRWKCWKCWALTLTRCSDARTQTMRNGELVSSNMTEPRCFKSAVQHCDDKHLCEDHARWVDGTSHTLLALGRYRIPTKVSWVLLLLLLKFLISTRVRN